MKYVALLRGIMPQNPNMRGEKLRGVLEKLGFENVKTVINSGNVVFDSRSTSSNALEKKIEAAWPKELGFKSCTIIRSQEELKALYKRKPFKTNVHSPKNYLTVTFFKNHSSKLRTLPRKGPGFTVRGIFKREICTAVDTTHSGTPEMMRDFEKQFGKEMTTRTWKTLERILRAMEN